MPSVEAVLGRPVDDVLGVGFGPSNLALAVALHEHPWQAARVAFVERRPRFAWHPGMLIEGATMQVSFLKDLATLRRPTSPFSFLNYLHTKGRLVDFINHKDFFPSRVEYHDYLEWAAEQFTGLVTYGTEVRRVTPVQQEARTVAFDVLTHDLATGAETVRTARNLVLATGLVPRLPPGVTGSPRVWHSSELLPRLDALAGPPPRRFAVVGAGQSAAEVTAHLHTGYPDAEVYGVIPRYGYTPADDSPFANQVFDPSAVDDFYASPPAVQGKFYDYHANTNYSVVDLDLINELYRRAYQESVRGPRRLNLLRLSRITRVHDGPDRVVLHVEDQQRDRTVELGVDIVVFATGYHPMDPTTVLGEAATLCKRTSSQTLRVGRDYRVETADGVQAGIYLQGGTEHTHGLSASLLSNLSVRAWDIAESLAAGA